MGSVDRITISLIDYKEGTPHLIDLDTCTLRVRSDYARRNENIEKNAKLCKHCDGTGNEFMSIYRKCPECDGIGVKP